MSILELFFPKESPTILEVILFSKTNLVWTAILTVIVPALVSAFVTSLFKVREFRKNSEITYEFEQKREIMRAIGAHRGQLVRSAENLQARLEGLEANHALGWLSTTDDFSKSGYFFKTTVGRVLDFYIKVFEVEKAAIVLDDRYASPLDTEFLNFVALFKFIIHDLHTLFNGLPFNKDKQVDHIYIDNFRMITTRYAKSHTVPFDQIESDAFFQNVENANFLNFIRDISPDENRLRWDRLMSLHLATTCFLDRFGSNRHKVHGGDFEKFADLFRNKKALQNFFKCAEQFDLNQCESVAKARRNIPNLGA